MKISIIIPVYNYSQYVNDAIDSVLSQSGDNWDLLVINDGSTDNSEEVILDKLKHSEKKFRFISKKNEGLAVTRNLGIDETEGDFLLFLDADDIMCFDVIQKVSDHLSSSESKLISGGHINSFPCGTKKRVKRKKIPEDSTKAFKGYLNHKFSLMCSATFFHRSIFEKIRYSSELKMNEDLPVFAQILSLYKVDTIDVPFVIMRKHLTSMRNQINRTLETGFKVVDVMFNPNILPESLLEYKSKYKAIRSLSIACVCLKNNEYQLARVYYKIAVKEAPLKAFMWFYLRRLIRARLLCGNKVRIIR